MSVCAVPGCPELTTHSRCDEHRRAADKARGTSTERGYGAAHQKARQSAAKAIATGHARCARCHEPLITGEPFDLDHDDQDRTKYIGPSHVTCNRSAAGKASHQ